MWEIFHSRETSEGLRGLLTRMHLPLIRWLAGFSVTIKRGEGDSGRMVYTDSQVMTDGVSGKQASLGFYLQC